MKKKLTPSMWLFLIFILLVIARNTIGLYNARNANSDLDELNNTITEALEDLKYGKMETDINQKISNDLINYYNVGNRIAEKSDLSKTGTIVRINRVNSFQKPLEIKMDDYSTITLNFYPQELVIIDSNKDIIFNPDTDNLYAKYRKEYEDKIKKEEEINQKYELIKEEMAQNFSYNDKIAKEDDLQIQGRVIEIDSDNNIRVEWFDKNTVQTEKPQNLVKIDAQGNIIWKPPLPSELPNNKFDKFLKNIF